MEEQNLELHSSIPLSSIYWAVAFLSQGATQHQKLIVSHPLAIIGM